MVNKEELRKLFGRDEYEVEFFKEKGFIRKRCKVCGIYFWTLDPDRETCGDVECEQRYRFIKGDKWKKEWDVHATINKWTQFFHERGHEILDPYPVVARWRDDIEFTIASIAVFQPWVVEGIVDPPANPLVIPQPCLRFGGEFSDIDNIGKTGRHLTSFTMGGQHAFNSKKFKAYWKDQYVRYNFEFMTKVLKIPEEELTYKEDVWAGGGNFGPSLETFAYGLELVNGVFMQYKFTDGGFTPLDLKVLDVGWGLERLSWFMQGTPTIYESTFGPVFEWLIRELGVEVDKELLVEYSKLSGMLDTSSPEKFNLSRKQIANALGMDLSELERILGPIEAIYAILDHTKTLALAIPDGGIPSNVGGYYNLRVIIRRALTLAEKFGFNVDWETLLHKQIEFFSKTFTRMREGEDIIYDIWLEETKRYRKTLDKGVAEIHRLVKKKKLKKLEYPQLRDIYLAYGIPPETISEIAKKFDVEVIIPSNFYDLIRKEKLPKTEEIEEIIHIDELEKELGEIIPKIGETVKLYYEDRYLKEFEAKVLAVKGKYLILDKTAFYPIGGGQEYDTGVIFHNENEYKVVSVKKVKNAIVHELDRDPKGIKVGDLVKGVIDWDRRYALMRHHTATHIINGAARRVLGPHVWQVGADKSPERARLDISHYRNLSANEIKKIERLANKIVFENRPVITEVLDRTSAERKYGITIYQGGAIPEKMLRIVNIKDWDVEACGGTHLNSTGEVGLIKIINVKKIHDGVIRLTFVAGDKALDYIDMEEKYLKESSQILRVNFEDLPKTVDRFFKEWKEQLNIIKRLANLLIENLENISAKRIKKIRDYKAVFLRLDTPPEFLITGLRKIQKMCDVAVLGSLYMGSTTVAITASEDVLKLLERNLLEEGFKCNKLRVGIMCNLGRVMDVNSLLQRIEKILEEKG